VAEPRDRGFFGWDGFDGHAVRTRRRAAPGMTANRGHARGGLPRFHDPECIGVPPDEHVA
jgi:hypothetical protein